MKPNIRRLAVLFLLFSPLYTAAQNAPQKISIDSTAALWNVKAKKSIAGFGSYEDIAINQKLVNDIYNSDIGQLTVPFTSSDGIQMSAVLSLKQLNPINVKVNNKDFVKDINLPKMFSGTVTTIHGKSNVVLTLSPGYLSLQAYLPDEEITAEKDMSGNGDNFMLQRSKEIYFKPKPYQCGIGETSPGQVQPQIKPQLNKPANTMSSSDKCTYVFVDCSNNLYINRGSNIQNTVDYVYTIWNSLSTMYTNEQMNVKIAEINVWQVADPFNRMSDTEAANRSFADYYKDNFYGNMAMLLDWSSLGGGIAGGYGWAKSLAPNVCGTYDVTPDPSWNFGSYAYCNLNGNGGTFLNFPPAFEWPVKLCSHELGHLFSSRHTHSCLWPGGPIDNCAPKEDNCPENGTTPVNGGTIMSYCNQVASVGVNFNKGFGPLPGDQIRAWVVSNACISNCTCTLIENIGTITQEGFHHIEASFSVTANGSVPNANTLIKLDAGIKVTLLPGFKAMEGSKVNVYIDGCGGIR